MSTLNVELKLLIFQLINIPYTEQYHKQYILHNETRNIFNITTTFIDRHIH